MIFNILSDIAQTQIPSTPALALPNLKIETIPNPLRRVTTNILLAARQSITRHWKTDQSPTIENSLDLVNLHYNYELIFASTRGLMGKTQKGWLPWTQWSPAAVFI